jgi:pimeloyl-ACP methyl ester carboxylesterase
MSDQFLLVVHDAGDPEAGRRWQPLVDGWPGPGLAPDLPGHGDTPPPIGASYAPGDAALVADRILRDARVDRPVVVVGHGWGAYAAELLASAGRVAAVVLVDGLGAPWATSEELVEEQHRWLQEVLADPAAMARPPERGLDRRLTHGFPTQWERGYTEARRASIKVPVVAVEAPASEWRADRLASFGGPTRRIEVADIEPATVLAALTGQASAVFLAS